MSVSVAEQTVALERATGGVRIGCDVGGTFTDVVLQKADGQLHIRKFSTTPDDPSRAIVQGIKSLLQELGIAPEEVAEIVHGTTTASNVILEKKGALTGVITTQGFRDILEIGRIRTPTMFDLGWSKPEPLSSRRYRRGVRERVSATGEIVSPLLPEDVREAAAFFLKEGVQTVAICFINSYRNPVHELAAKRIIEAEFPALTVTVSCEVLPEMREYERLSTTVVNAYILPAMRRYLSKLKQDLGAIGVTSPVQVMASNGGMMGVLAASERPVFAVASGPAGGITGAARIASLSGVPNAIAFDMGGTTAKASIIEAGEPSITNEYEFRDGISSPSRFVKGGGYVLKVPSIDIAEVGAGGGSIAWVDAGGLLQVGPESVGSMPGPACYLLGNDRPTVTDANVALGYLNPHSLAGGSLQLDSAASRRAIEQYIGRPLGLDFLDAAHGIRHLANVNMARAIRAVTVERGRDPRELALIAFGGGGPAHAVDVARILGIKKVVAPVMAGVFASAGMLIADVEHDLLRSVNQRFDTISLTTLEHIYASLREEALVVLAAEGYSDDAVSLQLRADIRFVGQSSELQVKFAPADFGPHLIERLQRDYLDAYQRAFGYSSDEPLELVNLRLVAFGHKNNRLQLEHAKISETGRSEKKAKRPISFFRGQPLSPTPVIDRADVGLDVIKGPVIVEAYDTTIVVPPDATITADRIGNLIIEVNHEN